jgi:squalene synthase HpnC
VTRPLGSVANDLQKWGPGHAQTAPSRAEGEAYCRRLATSHYENFAVATVFLPQALRQHFYNVYAFCRWADDLGDEMGSTARSLELLGWWREELHRCYAGETARHPVFAALASTIARFQIPMVPFADLISAFEQDQRVTEYATFDELRDYCRRSADPVGRIVLALCEQNSSENIGWSDSICTGLQLANFWQDVARDFRIGRIYLPREDWDRFGVTRDDFGRPETTPAFARLMAFEVDRARQWLHAGLPLVSRMPGRLQIDIDLFARGGLKILDRIERCHYKVWEQRPVVTKGDAVGLLCSGLCRHVFRWWGLPGTTSAGTGADVAVSSMARSRPEGAATASPAGAITLNRDTA